jgi:hypothetical protein
MSHQPSPRPGLQELLSPDGPGIMCAVAAAFPDNFLTTALEAEAWQLPPGELLYHLAGSVVIEEGCSKATIDVGEVRLDDGELAGAVPELGVRLGVLRWLVNVGWGIELVERQVVPVTATL